MKKNIFMGEFELNDKSDLKISIAIMSSFVILTIQYFILVSFNMLETSYFSKIQLISKLLVGIFFIYALPDVIRRNKIKFILVYFFAITIFLVHYLIFPKNRLYIQELLLPMFFMNIPALIYSLSITNLSVLKKIMIKASYIVFILGTILAILDFSGLASVGIYSMPLSYYMLLPAIMFLDRVIDDFSLKTLLFAIFSTVVILSIGSRGAILCILVFVFLKFIRSTTRSSYKGLILRCGILGIGIIGYIFINEILQFLYVFLAKFGIRSRSLLLFLREDIHLGGRTHLYNNIKEKIIDNPILGLGLSGDRVVLDGDYVHNFLLEVIANFGLVTGIVILGLLFIFIMKALFIKNRQKYNIFIIWMSLGAVQLIVSSSYLINIKFWIFFGVLLNILFLNKKTIIK